MPAADPLSLLLIATNYISKSPVKKTITSESGGYGRLFPVIISAENKGMTAGYRILKRKIWL
jgi:hypothetical protein